MSRRLPAISRLVSVFCLIGAAWAGRLAHALPVAGPDLGGHPRLIVRAPDSLRGAAARLRSLPPGQLDGVMRLMGMASPGPPILVVLAPEGSDLARGIPPWVSGYAYGERGIVVLFPSRAPTYPDFSLEGVLRHEVAHVLAARAAHEWPLPRWFDEGLAMLAGASWSFDDRSQVLLALLVDGRMPLSQLESRFSGTQREIAGAYALAGAFLRDIVQRHGPGAPARILAAVARGLPFDQAFARATGSSLTLAEDQFWSHYSLRRWLPLATSSATLWLAITLLFLYARRRRRLRDAALRARWDAEEKSSAAGGDEPVN